MLDVLADRYVYVYVFVVALLTERHLVKKLVELVLFQTAVFLFFIEGSVRDDGDVPVIGVALSLIVVIHRAYGTLNDVELSSATASPPPRAGAAETAE